MRNIVPAGRYFRLTPEMADGRSALDDASPQTVDALSQMTADLIARNDKMFDDIAAAVTQ